MTNSQRNWASTLYCTYPQLELPFLEEMIPQSRMEVKGICKILEKCGISGEVRILDLSCGIGRHSIELARRGFDVVGYDPSEFLIAYAEHWLNRLRKRENLRLRFVHGQLLDLQNTLSNQNFDVAISMGNSFGFVDENYDIVFLRNIAKVVNQRSLLIMELENRDWTLKNFRPKQYRQKGDVEVYEDWRFDAETSVFIGDTRFYEKHQGKRISPYPTLHLEVMNRVYSLHEMIKMLSLTGWSYRQSYDSIRKLVPVRHGSQDLVIVALNDSK